MERSEISGRFPSERVFILYAAGDARFCLALASRLRSFGFLVAHDTYTNDQFNPQVVNLEQEFRLATTYIVLVSRAALASPRVRNQLRRAYEMQREPPTRRILPVVTEPMPRDAVLALLAEESLTGELMASARVTNAIVDAQNGSLTPVLAALGVHVSGPISPQSPLASRSPLPPRSNPSSSPLSFPSMSDSAPLTPRQAAPYTSARTEPQSPSSSPRLDIGTGEFAAVAPSRSRQRTASRPATLAPARARRTGIYIAAIVFAALALVSGGLAVTRLLPGLGGSTTGSASATATALASKATASPTPSLPIGLLTVQSAAAPGQVNLTTQGTMDWAHWGESTNNEVNGLDHKSGGGLIAPYSASGTVTTTNCATTFSWSDGSPASSDSTSSCIAVSGAHSSFTFTVLADTTPRTLQVYMGANQAVGLFTAALSDDSALVATNTALNSPNGAKNVVFTITYHAASAGQQLTISLTQQSGSGSITLQAATLAAAS